MAARMTNFRSAAIATGNAINDSAFDKVEIVATNIDNITVVSDAITEDAFSEVIAITSDVVNVSRIADKVTTVASMEGNIDTVIGMNPNITTVVNDKVNIDKVAGISTDVTTVSSMEGNIDIVVGIDNEIVTVVQNIEAISNVSNNIDAIASLGTVGITAFSLTHTETVLVDSINSVTLPFTLTGLTPQLIQVYVDGLQLAPVLDYTTSGTDVVNFTEPKYFNQYIRVVGYTEYDVADTYTQAEIDNKVTTNIATRPFLVDNILALRYIEVPSNFPTVEVLGYYSKGDGGGGLFYWDDTTTALLSPDNGGTIIHSQYPAAGVWRRVYSGAVNVKWFGAKDDQDATVMLQAALDNHKQIFIPAGNWYLTDTVYVKNDTMLFGTGVASKLRPISRPVGTRWTDIDGGITDNIDFVPAIVCANSYITFKDFLLFANNVEFDAGIYIPSQKYINITNVQITGKFATGLYIDGTWSDRNTILKNLHPKVIPSNGNNEINVTDCRIDGVWALRMQGVDATVRNPLDYYGAPYTTADWLWSWAGTSDISFTNCIFRNATDKYTNEYLSINGGLLYDSVPIPNGTGSGAGNFHRYTNCAFRASSPYLMWLDYTNGNNFIACGGETTGGYLTAHGPGKIRFTNHTGGMTRLGDDINAAMLHFNGVTENFLDREDFIQNGDFKAIFMTRNNNEVLNMPGIKVNKEEGKATVLTGYDPNNTIAVSRLSVSNGIDFNSTALTFNTNRTTGYDANEYAMVGTYSGNSNLSSGLLQCIVTFGNNTTKGKIEFMASQLPAALSISATIYNLSNTLDTKVALFYYYNTTNGTIELYIKSLLNDNTVITTIGYGDINAQQTSYDNLTPPNIGSFVLVPFNKVTPI